MAAHSEKELARPTFKKGFSFHPLLGFFTHGSTGGGQMLAYLLWPGNAGSNTTADHATVIGGALSEAMVRLDQTGLYQSRSIVPNRGSRPAPNW